MNILSYYFVYFDMCYYWVFFFQLLLVKLTIIEVAVVFFSIRVLTAIEICTSALNASQSNLLLATPTSSCVFL